MKASNTKFLSLTACGSALAAMLFGPAASAAVLTENFNLGGSSQNTTIWTSLSNTNPALVPDAGSAPGTFAVSGAYQAGFGVYSFVGDYTLAVTQGTSYDVKNVVFQLELAPNTDFAFPFGGGPLLSINGGQYLLAPTLFQAGATESRNTFGTTPLVYEDAVWQWDLSSVSANVTSVSVLTPVSIHSSTVGARIDTGDTFGGFVSPVPEPSALLLSFLGLGVLLRRR